MATINFQQFKMPVGIGNSGYRTGDARESIANLIYRNAGGIRAHALALKIYNSAGATEYNDDEVRLITEVSETYATPAFIDGLNLQLNSDT